MDKIIKADVSYLKFIVFFTDFTHMDEKGSDVEKWFSDAFPDYSLNVLKSEYVENISKLRVYIMYVNVESVV